MGVEQEWKVLPRQPTLLSPHSNTYTPCVNQVSTVTRSVNTAAGATQQGGAGGSKAAAGRSRAALRENVRG